MRVARDFAWTGSLPLLSISSINRVQLSNLSGGNVTTKAFVSTSHPRMIFL